MTTRGFLLVALVSFGLPPIGQAIEYDVYILTGQSNALGTTGAADGLPLPTADQADALTAFFWSNAWSRNTAYPPRLYGDSRGAITTLQVQQGDGEANPTFWGPEFGFARTLTERGHDNTLIIKATRGGGSNALWDKATFDASHDAGHMWGHVRDTVDAALAAVKATPGNSFRIRGLLYLQGESDTAADAAIAGKRLEALLTNLATHIEAQHPGTTSAMQAVVAEIAASGTARDRNTTTASQQAICKEHAGRTFVSTKDLPLKRDGIHFGGQAKLEIGRRMALALIGPPTVDQGSAIQPASCFGSHMVLQQGVPLPVWGRAEQGTRVTVSFGRDRREAEADATGRWLVIFPPHQATHEPASMVIQSEDQTLTLHDILVGEVWLCAGQSNMLMPLAKAADAKREVESAVHPSLRLFRVDTAAGGDRGAYPPEAIAALEPSRYATGAWETCLPGSAATFSAVGYFFGRRLGDRLDVPVGIVCIAVGGTPTEAWVGRQALADNPKTRPLVGDDWLSNTALDGWCQNRARENLCRAVAAGEPIPHDQNGPNHPFKPGFMWEAAVAPFVPLAIRGVVWYQGESNAESAARVEQHNDIFPTLVADWRRAWRRESLPFGIVQLPGMNRPDWPAFRDGQRRLAEAIPETGLIVTIDLGDPRDVHPRDKRLVGERAAAWALAGVYGRGGPATGPRPSIAEADTAGTITVRFTETGGKLVTTDGMAPRHFQVTTEDGGAVAISCRLKGDSVILEPKREPKEVASPAEIRHVRYAWQPFPQPPVNLTGSTGLPATPFQIPVREAAGP